MIIRIVKLEFHPENCCQFERLFYERRNQILVFPGCIDVQLLKDSKVEHVFFTMSHWESEDQLEKYRQSELFLETWSQIKPWFSNTAKAWSLKSTSLEIRHDSQEK